MMKAAVAMALAWPILLGAGRGEAQTASCRRVGDATQIAVANTMDQAVACSMSCELSDRSTPKRSFFCNNVVVKARETGYCVNVGIPGTPGVFSVTCSTQ